MDRKLLLAGFLLIAFGLALLAFTDPTLRVLIFGRSSLSSFSGGTSFNRSGFTFTGTRSALSSVGATSGQLVYTFVAFGMAAVGLILAIAGSLTR